MSTEISAGTTRQLCTFFLDGLLFGVDVTRVQEVIRHQPMTPVPLAPGVVRGLINLRGQIVTALDLRRRLDLPPLEAGILAMNVVVRRDEGAISLLVDEIGDVVDVDEACFEPPPEMLDPSVKGLIAGVYKLSPQLLLVLDTDLAVRVDSSQSSEGYNHGK
jgi:purine-binding chemotaxis protein CheW